MALLVVGLAVVCSVVKLAFVVWVFWLERKQDAYLESLEGDEEETDAKLLVGILLCILHNCSSGRTPLGQLKMS